MICAEGNDNKERNSHTPRNKVSADDRSPVQRWSRETLTELNVREGMEGAVVQEAFFPDGRVSVGSAVDCPPHSTPILSAQTRRPPAPRLSPRRGPDPHSIFRGRCSLPGPAGGFRDAAVTSGLRTWVLDKDTGAREPPQQVQVPLPLP